jgi:aminoglycoside 3-N-acetyltransferase I
MNFDVEKLEVRQLTQADLAVFSLLIRLFNTVFEADEAAIGSETTLSKLLSNNNFIALAAFYENELVGGLTAYELPMYYSDISEIFLYDLAVKSAYQRKGIGKSLIRYVRNYCTNHGINEFFVLAHAEDEHAVEFYRATGGKSEEVINFLYGASIAKE